MGVARTEQSSCSERKGQFECMNSLSRGGPNLLIACIARSKSVAPKRPGGSAVPLGYLFARGTNIFARMQHNSLLLNFVIGGAKAFGSRDVEGKFGGSTQ